MIAAPIEESAKLENHSTSISDNSLVENRLTGLLSKDNAYMKQAETQGNQQAQSRGLLSSSMAVGAVENSRIAAALPIAQQDASLYGQADLQDSAYSQQGNLNAQNYQNTGQLTNQQGLISGNLQSQQGNINSRLQSQQGDISSRLQGEQFGHNQQLASQQGDINSQLQSQQGDISSRLNGEQFANNQQLSTQSFNQSQQLQTDNQVSTIRLNTSNQVAAIETDPNMSADQKDQAINNLLSLQNSQVIAVQRGEQLAQTSFTYSGSYGAASTQAGSQPTQQETENYNRQIEAIRNQFS